MLQIKNLSYSIGKRELFSNTNLNISTGKKYALIGPNGAGKTTLFRLIYGELDDYKGTILKPKQYKIGYLPQEEISFSGDTVLSTVTSGVKEIESISEKLSEIHNQWSQKGKVSSTLLKEAEQLQHKFQSLDGYTIEYRAKKILSGLGFSESDMKRKLWEFSGGWKMKAYLSRLLIQNPDLLLLDEPTNHLDLSSLEWLETFLQFYKGSVLIVSHDRFFIDRMANGIYEMDHSTVKFYPGNYHFYESEKEKIREIASQKKKEYLKEKERLEKFIHRFRYKASKATQAQDRIKQLEKLEQIEPDISIKEFTFNIGIEKKSALEVLKIQDLFFKYDSDWILSRVNLEIHRGDKIAIVGMNGSGKTTLTRLIFGQLNPQSGSIGLGKNVQLDYYSQNQLDSLNLNSTVFEEVSSVASFHRYPQIRDILGLFGFRGDDVCKHIKVLSGGEKARIALVKILISSANFLIMDEPLNHLDMVSKQALELALTEYEGTLMLISHDRYFLDKIVNRVVEIRDGMCETYQGNYSYYMEKRDLSEVKIEKTEPASRSETSKKQRKKSEAEQRQKISTKRNRLNQEIQEYEKQIESLEKRRQEIELTMSQPETYEDSEVIIRLQKELAEIKKNLTILYHNWELAETSLTALLDGIKTNKADTSSSTKKINSEKTSGRGCPDQ